MIEFGSSKVRDEIKSSGKIPILSQFKIAGGGGPSEGESLG